MVVKSFTAMAKRTTPNIFLIILIPERPSKFSILCDDFKIRYTIIMLISMAIMILITWYSARIESREVNVPAPAIIGNAKGTIEAVSGSSSLYKLIPKTISMARKKMMKEPATAKELVSIPMSFKISSPTNKKAIIMTAETIEAFSDCI